MGGESSGGIWESYAITKVAHRYLEQGLMDRYGKITAHR